MEFGCIGPGGVENNKDRPSECSIKEVNIQLMSVNKKVHAGVKHAGNQSICHHQSNSCQNLVTL